MERIGKVVGQLNLASSESSGSAGLVTRELEVTDFGKGFLELLGQLTVVGEIGQDAFKQRFKELRESGMYRICVVEDVGAKRIVAAATLLIEKKFIRQCGLVGHVEDVVVDKRYRGKWLGFKVVDQLKMWAKEQGCYKIILDCKSLETSRGKDVFLISFFILSVLIGAAKNVPFYSKLGFEKKEEQMAHYFR